MLLLSFCIKVYADTMVRSHVSLAHRHRRDRVLKLTNAGMTTENLNTVESCLDWAVLHADMLRALDAD